MREQGVVSFASERKKHSMNMAKRQENNDNNSSSNGRRRLSGLMFEGKGSPQRPAERPRGVTGTAPSRDSRDQRPEKKKPSEHLTEKKRKRGEEEEGEEEEEEEGDEELKRKPSLVKREDVFMVLHWGLKKRPRCSRMDESSVFSRKTVRVTAAKVVHGNGSSAHGQGIEKKAHEWRLKSCGAELRNLKGEHGGGGSKGDQGGGSAVATEGSDGGEVGKACQRAAPASPEKVDTISTRHHTRNPCPSPAKDAPDHNGSEAAHLKLEVDWPKIVISLSRKEKEEDFFLIKGAKLSQRPKRRPKVVEKSLLYCCPGSWLSDLTRGRYDVREKKCVKKKARGLKAMENLESDSE